jgi:hypothetical protein
MSMKKALVLGFALLGLVGCAHTAQLKNQAAHDFHCSESEIVILNGGRLRDVQGCGKKATYKWTGSVWVLYEDPNAPQQQVAQPAGPPPVTYQPVPVQPANHGPGQPGVVYVTPSGAQPQNQQTGGVQPVPIGQPQPVPIGK